MLCECESFTDKMLIDNNNFLLTITKHLSFTTLVMIAKRKGRIPLHTSATLTTVVFFYIASDVLTFINRSLLLLLVLLIL